MRYGVKLGIFKNNITFLDNIYTFGVYLSTMYVIKLGLEHLIGVGYTTFGLKYHMY